MINKLNPYTSINKEFEATEDLDSLENESEYLNLNIDSEIPELLQEIKSDQDSLERSNEEGWAYDDNDNTDHSVDDSWGYRLSDALDRADKESDDEFRNLLTLKELNGHKDFYEEITDPAFIDEIITSQLSDMDYEEDVTENFLRLTSPNSLIHEIVLEWISDYLKIENWKISSYSSSEDKNFILDIHHYKSIWMKVIENVFARVNLRIEKIPNDDDQ